jgi:hypothetical protein
MKEASLDKWAALGVSMLLLGIASLMVQLKASLYLPALPQLAAWHDSYASIRTLAALVAGLCGIGALWLGEARLALMEFSGVALLVLAALWEALLTW